MTNAKTRHPSGSSIHMPTTVIATTPIEKLKLAICVLALRRLSGHASASMSTGTNAAPTPSPTKKRQSISTEALGAIADTYPPTATSAFATTPHGFRPSLSASAPITKHPSICPKKMLMATRSVSAALRLNSARMCGRIRLRSATSAASLAIVTHVTVSRKPW